MTTARSSAPQAMRGGNAVMIDGCTVADTVTGFVPCPGLGIRIHAGTFQPPISNMQ